MTPDTQQARMVTAGEDDPRTPQFRFRATGPDRKNRGRIRPRADGDPPGRPRPRVSALSWVMSPQGDAR